MDSVYKRLPLPLQNGLVSLRALTRKLLREGKHFDQILNELRQSGNLSCADLVILREARLGKVLTHAVTNVPFYRTLGLDKIVAEAPVGDALAAFPIINKQVVREQSARFIAETARRPLFKIHTSGTTGAPLTLYQDLTAINHENAFIWRQLEWAGLKRSDRRAWLRGDLIVPVEVVKPPFWRMNCAENMLMFSSYHLSDGHAPAYIKALEHFDPVVIQAYPSSIAFLAKWLETGKRAYGGHSLRGIVTSSEMLDEGQRTVIEAYFGCAVYDWYGQSERVAAIGTCEHGQRHLIADYSWVELLPADDGQHEIVGSSFNNLAMSLIRYRTGDFVILNEKDESCVCGRQFPLISSVLGRTDDAIKLPDGRRVTALFFIFKNVNGILEGQIRQDKIDLIDILVVSDLNYDVIENEKLLRNARQRLGDEIEIKVRKVDAIPRTRNGKLRSVVCNV